MVLYYLLLIFRLSFLTYQYRHQESDDLRDLPRAGRHHCTTAEEDANLVAYCEENPSVPATVAVQRTGNDRC